MDPTSDAALGVLPGTTGAVDPSSAYPIAGQSGVASTSGGLFGFHTQAPPPGGNSMLGAVTTVWDWLNQPFTKPMSPMTVFAFTGSVIIAILVWNMLLYHIRIAAESV